MKVVHFIFTLTLNVSTSYKLIWKKVKNPLQLMSMHQISWRGLPLSVASSFVLEWKIGWLPRNKKNELSNSYWIFLKMLVSVPDWKKKKGFPYKNIDMYKILLPLWTLYLHIKVLIFFYQKVVPHWSHFCAFSRNQDCLIS